MTSCRYELEKLCCWKWAELQSGGGGGGGGGGGWGGSWRANYLQPYVTFLTEVSESRVRKILGITTRPTIVLVRKVRPLKGKNVLTH